MLGSVTITQEVAHVEPVLLVPREPLAGRLVPASKLTGPDVGEESKMSNFTLTLHEAVDILLIAGVVRAGREGPGHDEGGQEEDEGAGEHLEVD